jgi:hypothetical protein
MIPSQKVSIGNADAMNSTIVQKMFERHTLVPGDLGMAELMLWLTGTMKKTDADIRAQMHGIDKNKELNEELGRVIAALRDCESRKLSSDGCDTTPIHDIILPGPYQEQNWYKSISPEAQAAFDKFVADSIGGDGDPAQGGDWQAKIDLTKSARESLADVVSANSSANEMAMIKLQSAMSARGQAIQLISNMVNAFNETSKSVVGNIR